MSSEIYVLGCDVSKRTVDVALVDGQGVVQWTDKIANEVSTITTYFFTVGGALPDVTIRIAVEATGCYHYPVTESAVAAELGCIVYNPILTKQQIKGSVRGAKTDKTDAKEQLYKDLAVSAKGEVFARLQTIKGIGPYVAASLIGEIQDMTRFKTACRTRPKDSAERPCT
jgi:transposase